MQVRITEEEVAAVIRRIDMDGSGKIELDEWIEGLSPQEPFSKMLVRQRLSKVEKAKVEKKQRAEDKSKGRRVKQKKEFGEQDAV